MARPFAKVATALVLALATVVRAEEGGIEFFEKKIRPVLVEHCYECHGEKKQKGNLRLDSKAACEKGGETGPAVVPGDLDKSLLLQAVRYTDHDLAMPPEKSGGKLSPEAIATLEAWVQMGAPDPRTQSAIAPGLDMAKATTHWAFKPVANPAPPTVHAIARVQTPVDAFVLAKLEAKGLTLTPAADRRTLLRRVYLDLIGVPPTATEMKAFLADQSPEAFTKVVDQLLAETRYGERWARYWLDVARYADTKGYLGGGEERRFPFSFTYRDYVVRALVDDKPYDQFLREQLAADRLLQGDDRSSLAALGFLTLGRAGPLHDMIDDRIDVVTRGLMALTVTCARCHDHKFDPIPTADYYSLSGIFASSDEPTEKPLLVARTPETPEYQAYLQKRGVLEAKLEARHAELVTDFIRTERRKLGDYLLAARDARDLADQSRLDTFAAERKLATPILERWLKHLAETAHPFDPALLPWLAYSALPKEGFAEAAKRVNLPDEVPASLTKALTDAPPRSLQEVVAIYNRLAGSPDGQNVDEGVKPLLEGPAAPSDLPRAEAELFQKRALQEGLAGLRREIGDLEWKHPGAPVRAMAMVDKPKPVTPHILTRGNPGTPGAAVPRQFLEVLAGPERKPFTDGSGRLELAEAIASKSNPLTARVFVNRVWGWHFGQPLVRTPGDFGVRTEAPVEAELLDWLAAQFMANGWSIRQLHRQIVLSATYQQASEGTAMAEMADPDNALWHRFQRHRLDFESMRDSLLATAGRLDATVGGQAVEIDKAPYSTRRTLYGFIDRLNLPAVFRTFDFANPDISSPQRFSTTVPQQALFMMNSPFVVEQARALMHRPEIEQQATDEARLAALFQVVYQRLPSADEVSDAVHFIATQNEAAVHPPLPVETGWQFGWGAYETEAHRTAKFEAFAYSQKDRRSPQKAIPSGEYGYLSLTPGGGHPGRDEKHAAILRWVSPVDGEVSIEGSLEHGSGEGDGVHARIVSSQVGKLGEYTAFHGMTPTNIEKTAVKTGDTIDFIVDCRAADTNDSYGWNPRVTYLPGTSREAPKGSSDPKANFLPRGQLTPLTAWETLAQALLVSNEMMFIE